MKLSKKFESKNGKQGRYRVRRYSCTVCDYSELITADGAGEEARVQQARNDIDKMYKQSENNQL
jgi:hypothetical protein